MQNQKAKYSQVREVLEANNCTWENDDDDVFSSLVCYKNLQDVAFTLPCGHQKVVQAQYLPKIPGMKCNDCELWEKYSYNCLDKTLTCKSCDSVSFEVPRSNLKKYLCMHCCEQDSSEISFFRGFNKLITDLGIEDCYITRNCQYESANKKALTADFKIVFQGQPLFIEIDEQSHLSKSGSERHLEKQELALRMGVPLLRLHSDDVEFALREEVWETLVKEVFIEDRQADVFFVGSEEGLEFYSHKRFKNVYQENAELPEWFRLLARDEEEPEFVQEPEVRQWRGTPEFEEAILALEKDIYNRVDDLKAFKRDIEDNPDDVRNADVKHFLDLWDVLAFLILACPDMELIEVIKEFLTKVTSLLLFNERKLTLEDDQTVEEHDIEQENTFSTE